MSRLGRPFFERETLEVARDLLGCVLVRVWQGQRLAGRVVEVEAYRGLDDRASHAHRGLTPRNAVMFGPAGVSYVYFIYGMYWLLNVVAHPAQADYPAAILLRALEPLEGLDIMTAHRGGRPPLELTNGPGRLTQALAIDGQLNATDMTLASSPIFFEAGMPLADHQICTGPRVGINVAEPWQSQPWRFWIAGNPHVSRPR